MSFNFKNYIKILRQRCYKRLLFMYLRKVKGFNKCLQCTNHSAIVKLTDVQFGIYEFVMICCDDTLEYKLLAMGFVPGTKVLVINNNGLGGNIIIKIRETRIALNYNVAKRILVKRFK